MSQVRARSSSISAAYCASILRRTRFARIADASRHLHPGLLEIFWAHRIEYDAGMLDSQAYWTRVAAAGRSAAK